LPPPGEIRAAAVFQEIGRTLGVEVDGKDIWDSSDHFRFLYEVSPPETHFWTTAVNTRNSHTEVGPRVA
jgi:hypothetical protein